MIQVIDIIFLSMHFQHLHDLQHLKMSSMIPVKEVSKVEYFLLLKNNNITSYHLHIIYHFVTSNTIRYTMDTKLETKSWQRKCKKYIVYAEKISDFFGRSNIALALHLTCLLYSSVRALK